MLLPRGERFLRVKSDELGSVFVVIPAGRGVRQMSAVGRLREASFDAMRRQDPDQRGVPQHWTMRAPGKAELWPVPDRDYEARVRDINGRDLSGHGRVIETPPVAQMVSAFANVQAEQQRQAAGRPSQVEHFGRVGTDES